LFLKGCFVPYLFPTPPGPTRSHHITT